MKSTAIIPIRVRGQGGQWKSVYILIAGSSSFHRALTSQLLACGWSKSEESSSFCRVLTSQLPEWLDQGSVSFVEGPCLWNQTLRRFLGSQTAFQVSSSQEVAAFFTLVWIQGMTPITLTAVGVARTTIWGPNWLKFFSFLIFNPYLIFWLIGMNPIAQRNGCPF